MKKYLFSFLILVTVSNVILCQNITFDEVINESLLNKSSNDILPLYNGVSDFGDIDGDGDLDLIISGKSDPTDYIYATHLYRNDGNGNFNIINNTSIITLHEGDLKFFDADGDNDNDLIISGTGENGRFSYLYLNDGLGNFTLQLNTPFINAVKLDIADVDGNGSLDVFIIGIDNNFHHFSKLYINDGLANFTESPFIFEPISYCDVKFFDFDNDNDQDLVYTGTNFGTSQYYTYQYANDGFGNFTLLTDSLFLGVTTGSMDVADVDGDNDLDIISSGKTGAGYLHTKLYINDGLGNFTLDSSSTFVGLYRNEVKFIDIDNDNDNDLILSGAFSGNILDSKTLLYINDGQGVFSLETPSPFENVYYSSISYADIDNDNDIDVLIAGKSDKLNNNPVIYSDIYTNNGIGDFSKKGEIFKQVKLSSNEYLDIDNDGDMDFIIQGQDKNGDPNTNLYKNNGLGQFTIFDNSTFENLYNGDITSGDIDNDNDLDIITIGRNSQGWSRLNIYLNDGLGNYTLKVDSVIENIFDGSVHLKDIDGDNDLDLFIQGQKNITFHTTRPIAILYKNDGLGNFSISDDSTFTAVKYGTSKLKDLDNDGDLDIFIMGEEQFIGAHLRIYKNDGNGNFFRMGVVFGADIQGDFELGDLNGDNNLDIFIALGIGGNNSSKIYFSDGNGYFTVLNNTNVEGLVSVSVKLVDVDNDSDLDLLQSGTSLTGLCNFQIYSNDGNSNFQLVPNLFSDYGITKGEFSVVDVDNDQDLDFLLSGKDRFGSPFTKLFKNDSLGRFTPISQSQFIPLYNSSSDYSDIDNDGDLDLIICGDTRMYGSFPNGSTFDDPKCYIYKNDGNGIFTISPSIILPNISFGFSKFVDIDNDGDEDLILGGQTSYNYNNHSISHKTYVLKNDGLGNFDTIPHNIIDVIFGTVNVSDIDFDGDLDLFITGDNNAKLYLNDGTGLFTEKVNPFLGVFSGAVDIGDVDGDNDLDILVSGKNTINNVFMNITNLYLNMGNNNFVNDNSFIFDSLADVSLKFGDLDNDNDLDVFMTGSNKYSTVLQSYILKNNGFGSFTKETSSNFINTMLANIELEDIDLDNDLDIIINGKNDGTYYERSTIHSTYIYLNNGNADFNLLEGTNLASTRRGSMTLFDIDNDNDKDILLTGEAYQRIKQVKLYRNTSCLPSNQNLEIFECLSYTSPSGASNYTTTGTYSFTDTLQKVCGADSLLNITLHLGANIVSDSISSCNPITWIDGITYNNSNNTASYTLTNQAGCDSIVTLNLVINSIDTASSFTDSTITLLQTGASYQWFDCNNNNVLIYGDTNQTIAPYRNGSYKAEISYNGCKDTSSCITIAPCNSTEIIYVSDASICDTATSTLSILNAYDNYNWSNGSSASSIIVNDSSFYYVSLSMNNGCLTNTDSLNINLFDCTLFIDTVNINVDTCLIDSNMIVMNSFINNITIVSDSVFVTWNFILNTGDTMFLDAGYTFNQNGVYSISITINCNGLKSNGRVFSDLIEIDHLSTSFVDTEKNSLNRLYPNPTSGYVSIISSSKNENITVDVLSVNGALIQRGTFKPLSPIVLNLKELEKALYFIRITSENEEVIIYKVIKN